LRTGVIFVSMHVSDNYRHTSHDGEPGFVFSSIMCVCVCVCSSVCIKTEKLLISNLL